MTKYEKLIIEIASDTLGTRPEYTNLNSYLRHDLGADELDMIELVSKIEDQFGFEIKMTADDITKLPDMTLGNFCALMLAHRVQRFSQKRCTRIGWMFLASLAGFLILAPNLALWITLFIIFSGLYKDIWDLIIYVIAAIFTTILYLAIFGTIAVVAYLLYLIFF